MTAITDHIEDFSMRFTMLRLDMDEAGIMQYADGLDKVYDAVNAADAAVRERLAAIQAGTYRRLPTTEKGLIDWESVKTAR